MDFNDSMQTKGFYTLDLKTLEYEYVENASTPQHIYMYLSKLITFLLFWVVGC